MKPPRKGFTLIELLVVICIIAVLAGLLMPVLIMVRRSQKQVATLRLMNEITNAVSTYVGRYGILGEPATLPFETKPWEFLGRRQLINKVNGGEVPLLDLPIKQLATAAGAKVTSAGSGEVIIDAFSQPFVWALINLPAGAPRYTESIAIASRAGTPRKPSDDLILMYTGSIGRWQRFKWSELLTIEAKPTKTAEETEYVNLKNILVPLL